ncbi:hypothetical protein BOTBODRAFT_123031, partial [Botryobasidium botryosum FD-172 SS1]
MSTSKWTQPRRAARAKKLLKLYLNLRKRRNIQKKRRAKIAERALHRSQSPRPRTPESLSSWSSLSSFSSSDGTISSDSLSSMSSDTTSEHTTSSDSDSDSSSDFFWDSLDLDVGMESDSSGSETDDDESDGNEGNVGGGSRVGYQPRIRSVAAKFVRESIEGMYAHRYELPRNELPRNPPQLPHLLAETKHLRPDEFRAEMRVTPGTFDALLTEIEHHSAFSNNSYSAQMPVEQQLAITLYRFGHYGNAVSLRKVAKWAGVGKGTVLLVTRRVMTALLEPEFRKRVVRLPTEEEKEEAMEWVERRSCEAWRGGWCMVDGTLIPLDERPYWYGESYYDRKCNYSLNFQIVSMPNLRIVDFGFGHTGSAHDATAWEDTYI